MQPDVSLVGDPSTGVAFVTNAQWGGTISGVGGTSVSAPEMAAMWADVLSACKIATWIRAMCPASAVSSWQCRTLLLCDLQEADARSAVGELRRHLAYNQVFYDIVYGDNQMQNPVYTPASPIPGFSAGPGYDQVTGVGVPFAGHLIQAITGQTVQ